MPKKKIEVTASEEVPFTSEVTGTVNLHEELLKLLKKEIPQCFEREPTSGFTPHINKLVEHIIKLTQ